MSSKAVSEQESLIIDPPIAGPSRPKPNLSPPKFQPAPNSGASNGQAAGGASGRTPNLFGPTFWSKQTNPDSNAGAGSPAATSSEDSNREGGFAKFADAKVGFGKTNSPADHSRKPPTTKGFTQG